MKSALWIIIAVILIAGGYWWWSMSAATGTPVDTNAASPAPVTEITTTATTTAETTPAAPTTVTVTYDGKAYSPSTVTVKAGDTVMFKNTSGKNMWVASDEHPTHTEYDSTSRTTHCAAGYTGATPFDQCKGEATDYSFTFTKAGTIGYHDHLNPSAHGTVTVQ